MPRASMAFASTSLPAHQVVGALEVLQILARQPTVVVGALRVSRFQGDAAVQVDQRFLRVALGEANNASIYEGLGEGWFGTPRALTLPIWA